MSFAVRLLLVTLVMAFTARSVSAAPDTASPPVVSLHKWLDAFNSGDPGIIDAFLRDHYPNRRSKLNFELLNRANSGGYELREITTQSERSVTGLFEERSSDQFVEFDLVLADNADRTIESLRMRWVPRPDRFPIGRLDEPALLTAIAERALQLEQMGEFSGVVLLANRDNVLFERAYGMQDRERVTRNSVDSKFRLGSMNKMFTGVAVLQLVQAGKIDLDAPLGRYLPEYRDAATRAVTVHQLLTHTGGTGDIFGPDFDANRLELRTVGNYVELYGKRSPSFPPGTRYEYSNYGYVLLGAIIERVSGQSYYDFVRERIFRVAGMHDSGSEPESTVIPRRAVGYTRDAARMAWVPNTATLPYRGSPAGGGYSTARDLKRFADALLAHRLLDARHTALLIEGKVESEGVHYAYGFDDQRAGAGWIGHNGGAPGMSGDLRIYPESGYVVAVLANLDPFIATKLADFTDHRLPEPSR